MRIKISDIENNYLLMRRDAAQGFDYTISMKNHRIVSLDDPLNNQDAATKYYVDTHCSYSGAEAINVSNENIISLLTNGDSLIQSNDGVKVSFGTAKDTACEGNDSRLSDVRTPTTHQLDGALHSVSGLAPGHFLKALTADTFGFAAHGLVLPSNEEGAANNFLTVYNNTTGAFGKARPTWADIDKTTSDIANIVTKSHTSLTDIGTNTHAQIDSHISNTNNPHSVTCAQIGAAEDTAVVHIAEVEEVTGVKTFSDTHNSFCGRHKSTLNHSGTTVTFVVRTDVGAATLVFEDGLLISKT